MKEKINRRNFLKNATIFGAGLLIGFKLDSPKTTGTVSFTNAKQPFLQEWKHH